MVKGLKTDLWELRKIAQNPTKTKMETAPYYLPLNPH
jgi:hypothetical protein